MSTTDGLGVATRVLLAVAALLGLGYAAWAFTARRGVFADFADGGSVSADDARTSDTIDTIFIIVAGVLAIAALLLWIVRAAGGKTRGGALDLGGLAVSGLGVVVVIVGLFLAGGVAEAGSTVEQGDRGVVSCLVLGAGFVVLSIGLILGIFATGAKSDDRTAPRAW